MALIFVGDRCGDHSPNSGYDQVCTLFPEAGWLSGRRLVAGELTWIRRPSGSSGLTHRLFHVLYGDCSGRALPDILRARWPQATIVSTFHQPVSRLAEDPGGLRSLCTVDAIITVSEIQARQLADFGVSASLHVVPHGVWTHVFRPTVGFSQDRRDSVLLVGNVLRDWHLTNRVLDMLARAGVKSVVLGSSAPDHLAANLPLVHVSPRVPEAELVFLYDRSAALFLPVVEATASNALLEAMAAGCPVVCTRFPSLVDEYLGDDVDAFHPGGFDLAVARLLRYVAEPARRAARSQVLIKRAEEFNWSRLRPRYAATYSEIVTRACSS
jgi:glycosyltransferase involved in cell wall biosynthesis